MFMTTNRPSGSDAMAKTHMKRNAMLQVCAFILKIYHPRRAPRYWNAEKKSITVTLRVLFDATLQKFMHGNVSVLDSLCRHFFHSSQNIHEAMSFASKLHFKRNSSALNGGK